MKLPVISLGLDRSRQKLIKRLAGSANDGIVVGVVVRNVRGNEADKGLVVGSSRLGADISTGQGHLDELDDDVKGGHADACVEGGDGLGQRVFGLGVLVGRGGVVDEPVRHVCGLFESSVSVGVV